MFKVPFFPLCRCRGTTKWVHQACIQRWIDEKQKGNTSAEVQCPQCNTPYVIRFPKANLIVAILDTSDKLIQRICPVRSTDLSCVKPVHVPLMHMLHVICLDCCRCLLCGFPLLDVCHLRCGDHHAAGGRRRGTGLDRVGGSPLLAGITSIGTCRSSPGQDDSLGRACKLSFYL
jgi:hypothetical protein